MLQEIYSNKVFFQSDDLKFGSSWRQVAGTFTTDSDTKMLVLRVARVPAGSPIRGKLWIDDFVLVEKSKVEGRS